MIASEEKNDGSGAPFLLRIEAGALRAFVLNDSKSRLNAAEPFVRRRIESAAKSLDEAADRLEAAERFVVGVLELIETLNDTRFTAPASSGEEA